MFAREGVLGSSIQSAAVAGPRRAALRAAVRAARPAPEARHVSRPRYDALGPTYVKLGQFLATRPDVVGMTLARDLESLQDKMPPFPQAEAEATIMKAFGRPLSEVFTSFGPPVAAASIAQVHRAHIATESGSSAVAVKVLRPGVERKLKADLAAFYFVARNAEAISAEARRLRLIEVVEHSRAR